MKFEFLFAWYDLWIGIFYDKKKNWLYILPLPMLGVIIKIPKKRYWLVGDNKLINSVGFWVKDGEEEFGLGLWACMDYLDKNGYKELSLVKLFEVLNGALNSSEELESFLGVMMKHKPNADQIVHTLNALSPIKHNLNNWEKFVDFSYNRLTEQLGEEEAKELLKVIV